jgi:hypothetical protein
MSCRSALALLALVQSIAHAQPNVIALAHDHKIQLGIIDGTVLPVIATDGGNWSLTVPADKGDIAYCFCKQ